MNSAAPLLAATPAPEGSLVLVRSDRARRYRLTLRRDGTAVATIPRRGSEREAWRFIEANRDWLERARARQQSRPRAPALWGSGTSVLWRGEWRTLEVVPGPARPVLRLGAEEFRVARLEADLRPALEQQFLRRARIELPARAWQLAAELGVPIRAVVVRNQRSRWGSCSAHGTISLNWRLVQVPEFVRDYLVCHELMHRREMNHSPRFWSEVAAVCPGWRTAERWLRDHGSLLGL